MKKLFFVFLFFCIVFVDLTFAQTVTPENLDLSGLIKPSGFSSSINLLVMMGTITLIPFFLISTTAFLRIVIVLSMLRQALATQQSPPNSVIISLSLFLTIFVMTPTFNQVLETAVRPYQAGKIDHKTAIESGIKPFRDFMLKHAREKDLALFLEFSRVKYSKNINDVPIYVIIPSFILSELKTAFQIGFLLFIPFVVVDLIISNILLSLGMFMLSPAMVSLPFKILLFVLVDGWNLIVKGLLLGFQ